MYFPQEKKRYFLKLFSSGVVGKILRKYIRSKNKFKLSVIKIDLYVKTLFIGVSQNNLFAVLALQGLFVPFARVGSGDPVRVLRLFHDKYTGFN